MGDGCRLAWRLAAAGIGLIVIAPASARTPVACAGAVLAGAAQLLCSEADPTVPPQFCTFKWELATLANEAQGVQGAFTIPAGAVNLQVFEGTGFARAMSPPIVLCQGRRGAP